MALKLVRLLYDKETAGALHLVGFSGRAATTAPIILGSIILLYLHTRPLTPSLYLVSLISVIAHHLTVNHVLLIGLPFAMTPLVLVNGHPDRKMTC